MATSGHWSRDLYTLWWRDAGTGRMRCSWHADVEALYRRLSRIHHDGSDPALYDPKGERLPFRDPAKKARAKKKRKGKKAPAESVESSSAPAA